MNCIYFGPIVGQVIAGGCCGQEVKYEPLNSCLSPEQQAVYAVVRSGSAAWLPVIVNGESKSQLVAMCEGCPFKRLTEAEIPKPPPKPIIVETPMPPVIEITPELPVIAPPPQPMPVFKPLPNLPKPKHTTKRVPMDRNRGIPPKPEPTVPGEPVVIDRDIPARNPLPRQDPEAPFKPAALHAWEESRRLNGRPVPSSIPTLPVWDSLYCIYRGAMLRTAQVGKTTLKVLGCHRYGECTVTTPIDGVQCCVHCPNRTQSILAVPNSWANIPSLPDVPLAPIWRKRLPIRTHQIVLNNSIAEHQGQLWMAYRNRWSNAEVRICRLDDQFNIISNELLEIPKCIWNSVGREDPRLFLHNGSLHCAFTGVESRNNGLVTHVMYARLNNSGRVEQCYLPHFPSRHEWEKNWSMFEHAGRLYCEYSFAPRVILEIEDDTARLAHITEQGIPVTVGTVRGGASPVLHDNEWFSFHHNVFRYKNEGWYGIGLHTFENKPPFALSRIMPDLLMLPIEADRPQAHIPHVVYPSGAVYRNGQWVVSYGYYDRYCELAAWDTRDIESALTNANA